MKEMFTQFQQVFLFLPRPLGPHPSSADNTYRDPGLLEVEAERERLSHEHVRVVTGEERSLQLLQLPAVEVRPGAPSLTGQVVIAAELAICNKPRTSPSVSVPL